MLRIIRGLLVSAIAAIGGMAIGNLFFVPHVGWIVLPFTIVGSFLVLQPGYLMLKAVNRPPLVVYLGLIVLGAIAGAIMLALTFFAAMENSVADYFRIVLVGSAYGALTAMVWCLAHFILGPLGSRIDQGGPELEN